MEHRRKKTHTHFLLVTGFVFLAILATTGCNARALVQMDKHGTEATVTVNVAFASFFVQYLRDLIGFNSFSDMVGIENFREFFESLPGTSYISASVSNEPQTITITIKTNNVHTLFSQFDIPFETKDTQTRVQITQALIKTLIAQLPAFQGVDITSLFVFDEQVVPKEKFAPYIGWALEDYANKEVIQNTVEKSHMNITLQKEGINPTIPDKGWKQKDKTTQERTIPLVDILYNRSYNVWYSQ